MSVHKKLRSTREILENRGLTELSVEISPGLFAKTPRIASASCSMHCLAIKAGQGISQLTELRSERPA
jgi:hypothetical protein